MSFFQYKKKKEIVNFKLLMHSFVSFVETLECKYLNFNLWLISINISNIDDKVHNH